MAGTCKENGSGSDAKKDDGRKTVYRKKKRKILFEMDGRCGSRPESEEDKAVDGEDERNGDLLLRRPRLIQGCSAERKEGRKEGKI